MSSPSTPRRPALAPLGVLVVAAASLVLTACGGSSATNAAATERSDEQKAETKFADFAKCMREHGIKVEATTNGDIQIAIHPGEAGAPNPESPAFQKARQACQGLLPFKSPGGKVTPGQNAHAPGSSESGSFAGGS